MALDPTLLIGLKALELYLDDMVIAGGWVPYLFAAHEQPSAEAVALKTRDLDIAVSRQVPEREKSIDQLLGEAGFTCEFRSLETPPVTAYVATHAGDEVEIEFITNAKGSGQRVHSVQSGLTAQELRYVDLLLANTWFRRCLRDLETAFEAPDSPGIDALLHQRPSTAYQGMDDDQFRQYAWSVMQSLLDMMLSLIHISEPTRLGMI